MIDPALSIPLAWFLAGLLALAASDKLLRPREFENAVQGYDLLPHSIRHKAAPAIATLLIVAELAAAILLAVPGFSSAGALAAACIFGIYAFAMTLAILRGRSGVDCGCHFGAGEDALGWPLVVRNAALIAIAGVTAIPQARATVWIDHVSGALAGGALIIILHSARIALANARQIRALKGAS